MQKSCPSCGAETFPGARFCRRCGATVYATGTEGTGDVSPQAATVPLESLEGRATDGLAPESGRASADTSRVSLAEMERLLRAQQDSIHQHDALPPQDSLPPPQGATLPPAVPADPNATLATRSAATRPEGSATVYDEEVIITVPRPPQTRETASGSGAATDFEKATDFDTTRTADFEATHAADFEATRPATDAPSRQVTRDISAFENSAAFGGEAFGGAAAGHGQPHGGGGVAADATTGSQVVAGGTKATSVSAGGARSPVASSRRRWPVVVTVCAVVLVFAFACAWLVFSFLRRPSVTDLPTQTPTAPVAMDAKQQFEEKVTEAETLFAQGNMEGALGRLREANTLDPSNTRAHRRLGELLLSTGARREAIDEFRAVTRNAPEDFTAWRQLATAQFAEGLYRDAAESYRRVVSLAGEQSADPTDLLSYADALRLSGRADEARAIYERLTSAAQADVASLARQRLAELARSQPTPAPTARAGEQTGEHAALRESETASATSPVTQAQPAERTPTPAPPPPTPTPQPARPAEVSPAEHYGRGAQLWSSNRSAALEEFRAAASGGNPDAHYYLGLSYVDGKNLHALKRAEVVAALQHFQLAQRGQFAEQSRRYAQQLEKEFDRLRKQ
jgi:tetratricopeptide (TPR) repeat protein